MALSMEQPIELPAGESRGAVTFVDAAIRLPDSTFRQNGADRLLLGAKFVPWGDDQDLVTTDFDCGDEDLANAKGTLPETVTQQAFTMTKGFDCSTLSLGLDATYVAARSTEFIERVASAVFTRELITGSASGGHSLSSAAARPQGNTHHSVTDTFGHIEDWFADTLGNTVGMVFVPPRLLAAMRRADLIEMYDNRVRLASGHVVVADAGFGAPVTPDGGNAANAGQTWIYASGPVAYSWTGATAIGDGRQDTVNLSTNVREVFAQGHGIVVFDPNTVAAFKVEY